MSVVTYLNLKESYFFFFFYRVYTVNHSTQIQRDLKTPETKSHMIQEKMSLTKQLIVKHRRSHVHWRLLIKFSFNQINVRNFN